MDDCRGQTYDEDSNMMGKHSSISTKISEEQARAIATRCQGHSLSLAVKSLTKECRKQVIGEINIVIFVIKNFSLSHPHVLKIFYQAAFK